MLGLGPEGDGRSPADSGGDARVAEFLLLIDGVPVTSLDGLFLLVTMLSAFLAFIHTIDSSQIDIDYSCKPNKSGIWGSMICSKTIEL